MGFFSDIIGGLVKVGGTLVGIASHYVLAFKERVMETVYDFQSKDTSTKEEIKKTRSVNDEIIDLEKKKEKDKDLNIYDQQKLRDLYRQRHELREKIDSQKEVNLAKKIADENGAYDSLYVSDDNLHVIQYHVGQSVLGKKCSRCGRPLVLQWKRGEMIEKTSEFFWGCSGFYDSSCRNTEHLTQTDFNLITNIEREEFTISNAVLNRIVQTPMARNTIRNRMNGVKNEETVDYFCPYHSEPMVVRENKDSGKGLLDAYFLGCPRHWDFGCKFIVKIKSPAQLAAILESQTGKGIL